MEIKIINLNSEKGIETYTIDEGKTLIEEFRRIGIIQNVDLNFRIRHEKTKQVLNPDLTFTNQNVNENDRLVIAFSIEGHSEELGMLLNEENRPTLEQIANEKGTKNRYKAKVYETAELRKVLEQKKSEVNQLKTDKVLLENILKVKKRNQIVGSMIFLIAQLITAIGVNYYTGDETNESLGIWLIGGGIIFNLYGIYRINE